MKRILHCLAQLPTRTGSGVYYHNLVCHVGQQPDWQQAALYAVPFGESVDWLPTDLHFPVCFDTSDLPFPIAGMSDEMPYPSTVYHRMDETQLTAWRAAFRAQLQEARRRFRPDIVICHHLWLLARLVLDVFGDIPVIGISHGTDIRQARQNPAMCAREVGSLRRLARVLALSEHHLDELCACFDLQPEQIVVTGGAIDTSRFFPDGARRARGPAEPVRLVYAGKMARAKGTYELIEAFGLARAADPHLSLDLIGRIPPALAAHIEAVGGTAAPIRIFDLESQAHFAEHLRRLDVFVFPSYFEGLGLVALEALASGLSLVANRLPPLLGQLGPRLSADPAVAWVDLPRLHGVDKIDPSERGAYIDRLAAAILRQAAYSRDPAAVSAHPYRELADHSWQRLSRRVLDLADQLMD